MIERTLSEAFLTSARAWRGSGVSFSHIAHGLIAREHRVQMLAGDDPVVEAFAGRGLPSMQVPTADTALSGARALMRALRAARADCLVVDRPRDLRLGVLASLGYPVAIVNRYNLSRRNPPRDLLSRLAYFRVSLTVFVSETSARSARSSARYLGRRPSRVIPEGVGPEFRSDPEGASAFRAKYGLGQRQFVLAVGSLTADKRYEFLFGALKRLGPGAPALVICGGGPLADHLQQHAATLGIEAHFLGLLSPEVLVGAYSAALCLVHACQIETFGLSVLEAMACSCPVIAVEGGAVPEVLGDAGVLTPPGDVDAFAARLQTLLADSGLRVRLGGAGRRRAKEQFSLAAMQQAYAEAIESVCTAGNRESTIENAHPAASHL